MRNELPIRHSLSLLLHESVNLGAVEGLTIHPSPVSNTE